ncbi:uncharacterized protein BDCG_17230 [Blastomyces dermatitidis ER-3]|uniref:Uncharacterized protein n=1 Tax=Ajellomyces dermatitidis (strain ER-3 / ATCC MYA-2586) TaxID=559297 RepID=A0ABX2VX94_AJEDR|nr:uncharacterized protein BDCG_17230 [Blastomyces dermatitidis ER-3]EQL36442.1 hypothetical protein BDFG_01841 [Blastomyces dermatitidis ATCC 26199]OAT01784.1 hypothetical protein BDCG_17230 [Blastomyces dermatitidis ER-3]
MNTIYGRGQCFVGEQQQQQQQAGGWSAVMSVWWEVAPDANPELSRSWEAEACPAGLSEAFQSQQA